MNNTELKKLLISIPVELCRNMNNELVKSILKELEIDFSQQHYVILRLLKERNELFITEFVEILGITKPQMTALIDKLILMGFVNRTNNKEDRRKIYVSLTPEGEEITSKINNTINNQIDNHLIKLTQKESEELEKGLLILQKLCLNCSSKNK